MPPSMDLPASGTASSPHYLKIKIGKINWLVAVLALALVGIFCFYKLQGTGVNDTLLDEIKETRSELKPLLTDLQETLLFLQKNLIPKESKKEGGKNPQPPRTEEENLLVETLTNLEILQTPLTDLQKTLTDLQKTLSTEDSEEKLTKLQETLTVLKNVNLKTLQETLADKDRQIKSLKDKRDQFKTERDQFKKEKDQLAEEKNRHWNGDRHSQVKQ